MKREQELKKLIKKNQVLRVAKHHLKERIKEKLHQKELQQRLLKKMKVLLLCIHYQRITLTMSSKISLIIFRPLEKLFYQLNLLEREMMKKSQKSYQILSQKWLQKLKIS